MQYTVCRALERICGKVYIRPSFSLSDQDKSQNQDLKLMQFQMLVQFRILIMIRLTVRISIHIVHHKRQDYNSRWQCKISPLSQCVVLKKVWVTWSPYADHFAGMYLWHWYQDFHVSSTTSSISSHCQAQQTTTASTLPHSRSRHHISPTCSSSSFSSWTWYSSHLTFRPW